ncbi:MAG TPA: PAS domain-containing protein, partial [Rhodocyclaceae bacterium]|nr:PAS domain-containing protein [Rhodocyclaceae bacterium]
MALVDAAGQVRAGNRREWRGRDAAATIPEFLAAEFAAVQQTPVARQRAEATGARAIAWRPYITSPSNDPPGAFFLLLDLQPRQTALLQDLLRTQAFNWIGALILLTVLYLWLSYYVVRPLETLRRELQSLDPAGNRPIRQAGPREITALIQAFNEMSSELAVTWRAIPDLLFEVDPHGRCIRLTTGRPELLTRPVESFIGQRVDEIMPPASAAVVMAALEEAGRAGGVWGRQIGLEGPGEHRWYEFSVARKDRGAGLAPHFIVFSHNITGRKHAEERQRLAARIFDASREGIVLTDAEGVIQMVNPAFVAITGYSADEAIGQSARLLDPHRHGDAFYAEMWRMLSSEGYWAGEIWSRRKDGQPLPEWLSMSAIRNEAGAVSHYVGVFTDLRELKASQARIHDLAWHHPLTSLPNRAFLLTRMEEAVGVETKTGKRGFALMLINLRGFQRVNASYGIEAGDAVLREAGRRAVNAAAGRLVCHLDGDEFG